MPTTTNSRGYFGIGIFQGKTIENIGTLWRSADLLGAKFIFTIGRRYKKQASDTMKSFRNIPLYHYDTFVDFYRTIPYGCQLVGIELDDRSVPIHIFCHPDQCIYILGAEDNGLSKEALQKCRSIIQLPGRQCMNVAAAGTIVMYDRMSKSQKTHPVGA